MTPSKSGPTALLLFAMLLSEAPLEAYLDPGSGSMLLQLLLGGFAGVAVLLRLAWRRLRDRFASMPPDQRAPKYDE